MKKQLDELKLKVGELTGREDFGRGIARLDTKIMRKIGVKEGDVIGIEGKRKTGAIIIKGYPADIGLNILRIDGLVRKNCDASIGEIVKIRKANAKEAKSITLAPYQKGFMLHISPNLLKQNLLMRPMMRGDIIITNPVFKKRGKQNDDIFSIFGIDIQEVFMPMGTETKLTVVKTIPDGITRITNATEVKLLSEAVEVKSREPSKMEIELSTAGIQLVNITSKIDKKPIFVKSFEDLKGLAKKYNLPIFYFIKDKLYVVNFLDKYYAHKGIGFKTKRKIKK